MAEPSPKPAEPSSAGPAQIWKKITDSLQTALAIGGAIAAALGVSQKERWALWIGSAVLLLSALWFGFARWRRARLRRKLQPSPVTPTSGAYIRGLLPFGQGESLLGRQGDLRQLLTKVSSSEFRFGYLSGEAGCGKTSLLRAGLLAEAEKAPTSLAVVYIPKPGTDPVATIAKAVRQKLGDPPLGDSATLHDFLVVAQARLQGRRLLVVCDQFEEFFLANRTPRSREPFLRAVGDCYADVDLAAGFLFSLRKEFVDDLQDFQKVDIPQPLDIRFSYRLRNWDATEALNVLREAARSDDVPFAEALESEIIRDLEQDGEVRPVELQIVAYHLREERIYELGPYNTAGRARGILKSYVRQVIEPSGPKTPEIERQLARHFLRSLCEERADAKRPVGLRFDEIYKLIRATLAAAHQGDLVKDSEQYEESLRRVLQRCEAAYLVIPEDEERYNLVHDYIVRPIREATSDIEPVEERANRMLDQYLEDQRSRPKLIMPTGDFRFITRYASTDRKIQEPAARLLRRTRRTQTGRRVALIAGLMVIFTLVKPPEVKLASVRRIPSRNWYSVLSPDGHLALQYAKGSGSLRLWNLERPWSQSELTRGDFASLAIGKKSRFAAAASRDGVVRLWHLDFNREGRWIRNETVLRFASTGPTFYHIIFSPDERILLIIGSDGKIYCVRTGTSAPKTLAPDMQLHPHPGGGVPPYLFSSKGKYVAVQDNDGTLLVRRLDDSAGLAALAAKAGGVWGQIAFSKDEQLLAFTERDGSFSLANLDTFPKLKILRPQIPAIVDSTGYEASFSHDGKWLSVVAPSGRLYLGQVIHSSIPELHPVLSTPSGIPMLVDYSSPIRFSRDSKWGASTSTDGALCLGRIEQWMKAQATKISTFNVSAMSFSPHSKWIAARSTTGGIYVWKLESNLELLAPKAYTGEFLIGRWFLDDQHILWIGRHTALWGGVADKDFVSLTSGELSLYGVGFSENQRALFVFDEQGVSIFKRQLSLWGIPAYTFPLPALESWDGDS